MITARTDLRKIDAKERRQLKKCAVRKFEGSKYEMNVRWHARTLDECDVESRCREERQKTRSQVPSEMIHASWHVSSKPTTVAGDARENKRHADVPKRNQMTSIGI